MVTLSAALRDMMQRAGVGAQTLSKLTGIPRTSIDNWREGIARCPKHWRSLLQIARVLALAQGDVDALLAAAGYPPVATLAQSLPEGHSDRVYLQPWLAATTAGISADVERRLRTLEGRVDSMTPFCAPLPHQLRAPIADFMGRAKEMEQLLCGIQTAITTGAGAIISGVHGMGGIGKTELAYLVAYRLSETFPDAQIVLPLYGSSATPLTAVQALQTVIRAFMPEARLPEDLPTLEQHYRSVLHGQRALILADDVADVTQVRALLPPSGCALLLTSRQCFALPGMQIVQLEQLDEETAVTLLRRLAPRLNADEARALAQLCGYLPLALRVCGSMLHTTPALPVADYLAGLADERRRLDQLRDPDDPQLDVAAALAQSYARLDAPAQAIFRQLGVLIADFTTDLARAVVAAPSDVELRATLRHLLRRNLVMYDAGRDRWRLHDLVRDLARRELEQAGKLDAVMWHYARAALRLAQTTQDQYLTGGEGVQEAVARFDAERAHIDVARCWAVLHSGTPPGDQLLLDAALATFCIGDIRYHLRREILPQREHALAAARRLGDRRAEGLILSYLGIAFDKLGDGRRAIPYSEQALAIAQAIGDRRTEGLAFANLGIVYATLGDQRCAIHYSEQALAIARAIGDRRTEGKTLGHLGNAYTHLGDPRRAISYQEQYLTIARALGDPCAEGRALGFLGMTYTNLGDPRRAIPYYEQSLTIFRALGDQRNEGYALQNLGIAYLQLGQVGRAIECSQGCHTIACRIGDRRLEGYALSNLAHAEARRGNMVHAARAFEQAVALFRKVGDCYGEAECQWWVGLALVWHGAYAQALPLLRAALAYEQEIGHAKVAEHAALLAQLEAGEGTLADLLDPASQCAVGEDLEVSIDDDVLP